MQLDLVLDDFVTKTFFGCKNAQDPTEIIQKVIKRGKISTTDRNLLEQSGWSSEYVWLQPGQDILDHMTSLVRIASSHLVDHLHFRKLGLSNLNNINYLITAKLVDWKTKRFTIYDVIEISDKSRSFVIKARNCFETFSNCKHICL